MPSTPTLQNPIAVALTESGGSGHAALQLNGGASAAAVTVTKSTDSVQVVYDGQGSAGYQAAVALSAAATGNLPGATENATLKPILFVSNPTVFYSAVPAQVKSYPEGQHVLAISEPTAASGTAYTATPSGCSNILRVGTVVGTGPNATLLVAGAEPRFRRAGCSARDQRRYGHLQHRGVENALRAFNAPVFLHEYPIVTNSLNLLINLAMGNDGTMWFSEGSGPNASISSIKPDGSAYTQHALAGWSPQGVTLGPDGNIWTVDRSTNHVGQVSPAGTITSYTTQSYIPTNTLAAGLDGLTWFAESSNVVGNRSTSGTLHEVTVPGGYLIQGVTLGPDGAIWFIDRNQQVGRLANGAATEFPATTSSRGESITAGADGNVWFNEDLVGPSTVIGQMTPAGTLTEFPITGDANYLLAGPDGAIWFSDDVNNAIGRISTSGAITEYRAAHGRGVPVRPRDRAGRQPLVCRAQRQANRRSGALGAPAKRVRHHRRVTDGAVIPGSHPIEFGLRNVRCNPIFVNAHHEQLIGRAQYGDEFCRNFGVRLLALDDPRELLKLIGIAQLFDRALKLRRFIRQPKTR